MVKEKGGWGLPSLREYYKEAAQLRYMMKWCSPFYDSQWKNIEKKLLTITLQAVIADRKIRRHINIINNPRVKSKLTTWKPIITEHRLDRDIVTLKWCAYDSEFTPNTIDNRLKTWTEKGITIICMLLKGWEVT